MKPNRVLASAEEATSPVIAIVLMVAITVVLGVAVFVLVGDVAGKSGRSAPAFGASKDDSTDRLTVTSASPSADWNRLVLKVDRVGGSFALNAETAGVLPETAVSVAGVQIANAADGMTAGEFLDFCGSAADVSFSISDEAANQLMGTWRLVALSACS